MKRFPTVLLASISALSGVWGQQADRGVKPFVDWLLEDEERLEDVRFAEVAEAVSGKSVLPVDTEDSVDAAMLAVLEAELDAMLEALSEKEHPIHTVGRVNEISRYVEDFLQGALDAREGYTCSVPVNASGELQRSGYPDLRFVHEQTERVFYIDPKVYKSDSERSRFRTFYFEPKLETNKILDDASHLIVGVAHAGKVGERWRLERWQIVDLIEFRVRLKAEFQASNHDLYRSESVLSSSKAKATNEVSVAQ